VTGLSLAQLIEWLREGKQLAAEPVRIGSPTTVEFGQICLDSRLAQPGSLFVALAGERVDGHAYIDDANRHGAAAALVDHEKLPSAQASVYGSIILLPVLDPLHSIQLVAERWRQQFPDLFRVGVTGSNGKTTTKEMIASILSRVAPTVRSTGNFNSEIGLPAEILRIRDNHRFGVFEMGINRVGEMPLLARMVEPDCAVITNIGSAHIGMFGSRDTLIAEKRSIFDRFGDSSVAVIPDDPELELVLRSGMPGRTIRYNQDTAGVRSVSPGGLSGSELELEEGAAHLPLPGEKMVQNALCALTVCRHLGAGARALVDGLEAAPAMPGRLQIVEGPITIIQDAYNANPESVRASLELLADTPAEGRRVAIVGAMKELGDFAHDGHREVWRYASALGLDLLWLIGDEFVEVVTQSVPEIRVFGDTQWSQLEHAVKALHAGDVVLLKGSRSVGLERLLPVIEEVPV
jgi:UDP-N-acetylmuramoyl-tripeptide--D-alanyl-D-alanine ligase